MAIDGSMIGKFDEVDGVTLIIRARESLGTRLILYDMVGLLSRFKKRSC